jgi:hypothetical protein
MEVKMMNGEAAGLMGAVYMIGLVLVGLLKLSKPDSESFISKYRLKLAVSIALACIGIMLALALLSTAAQILGPSGAPGLVGIALVSAYGLWKIWNP